MVATLKAGATFGELALISNKPRAATIRAIGDSHFATLDRRTFNIIKGNHEKALYQKVEKIKQIPFHVSVKNSS